MIASTAYADAFFGVPGGVYRMDARRLGAGYADGDPVQYLPDLLGRGRAVQDTLAARPLFDSDAISGDRPGLEFLGAQSINLPDACKIPPSAGIVVSCVFRPTGSAGGIIGWAGASTSDRVWYLFHQASTLRAFAGGTASALDTPLAINETYVVSLTIDENRIAKFFINENVMSNPWTAGSAEFTSDPVSVGARSTTPAFFLTGGVSDVVVYRGFAAVRQRETINRKLMRQWGIS